MPDMSNPRNQPNPFDRSNPSELPDLINGMPRLIQAGMGVHISSARLANATARLGALGVVSGVGLRHVVIEEVRAGNEEVIEAARTFPLPRYVEELLAFAPGGAKHHRSAPMDVPDPERAARPRRLSAICAYTEVKRAQKGHRGKIGINVMWKCALTVLPTLYGAMLAGVYALLCSAGIPMELPSIVRQIRAGEDLAYEPLSGTGTNARLQIAADDSAALLAGMQPPRMIPVLSNYALPKRILDVWEREYDGARPFAFVLENHQAGGHNAPPRNKVEFSDQDEIDRYFDKVRELDVPIYAAGAFPNGGSHEDLVQWMERGAYGIQVGSRFALCDESGLRLDLKDRVTEGNRARETEVRTDPRVSPTGYPFKYVPLPGTIADPAVYEQRRRLCNRGYLLQSHFETLPDGSVRETYLCPAMPARQYEKLGGNPEEGTGRVCLCNALLSTAGFFSDSEPPLVTLGVSGKQVMERLTARQVVEEILTPEYVAAAEQELSVGLDQ
jgi:NAD(P)H-dependent flavin oxidoreductase YrpB (nitropropane dioxygenase family)